MIQEETELGGGDGLEKKSDGNGTGAVGTVLTVTDEGEGLGATGMTGRRWLGSVVGIVRRGLAGDGLELGRLVDGV